MRSGVTWRTGREHSGESGQEPPRPWYDLQAQRRIDLEKILKKKATRLSSYQCYFCDWAETSMKPGIKIMSVDYCGRRKQSHAATLDYYKRCLIELRHKPRPVSETRGLLNEAKDNAKKEERMHIHD